MHYGKQDLGDRRVFRIVPGTTLEIEVSDTAGNVRATVCDSEGERLPRPVS
jgi:hypothetical protein